MNAAGADPPVDAATLVAQTPDGAEIPEDRLLRAVVAAEAEVVFRQR